MSIVFLSKIKTDAGTQKHLQEWEKSSNFASHSAIYKDHESKNKDIIHLIEDIEHYVQLKNQKNLDENTLNAEAYSLYRKFMNIIDT